MNAGLGWAVIAVNDDGRAYMVNRGMCALAAEKVAGAMRDASTERQIAEGWNFLPRHMPRGAAGARRPQARMASRTATQP